jgi:hypothetical protein
MRVDWRSQPVMPEHILGDGSRAEVLGSQHASCCHDPDQGVKFGMTRVLNSVEDISQLDHRAQNSRALTTHVSNDSANALEEDTSKDKPFRFDKMSCKVSKLVCGGGMCRLKNDSEISYMLQLTG